MRSRDDSNPKRVELSDDDRLLRPNTRPVAEQERRRPEAPPFSPAFRGTECATFRVTVDAAGAQVEGELTIPPGATGIVLFAHCSDACRHSARSRQAAEVFHQAGLATFLVDLLSETEEARGSIGEAGIDVGLLAWRWLCLTTWLREDTRTRHLRIGYFGAGLGGAAALVAAALKPWQVATVVSWDGDADLAAAHLPFVRVPTLLVAEGGNPSAVSSNRSALEQLRTERELVIIPPATYLFEELKEPQAEQIASDWFLHHLAPLGRSRGLPSLLLALAARTLV
jgi:dienelactone hydrolase